MRLFTAIELGDDAREAVVAEQARVVRGLRKSSGALRLVRPEHLHLTLVFVGHVSDDQGAAVVRAMSEAIAVPPFRLVFGGVGAFPPRGAPRVLYLGVIEGHQAAVELHGCVVDRLAPLGVERDRRPFHPHLTLGRWRESRPSDRPRAAGPAKVAEVDVAAVALFQSRLSASGPTYTRLAAADLACL
jgi:2'-5' RNA ligase